jgi:histone deacetylase complex regulatory component SIN3
VQVQHLFKDSPDLLQEFQDFLPDVVGHSGASALGSWGGSADAVSKNAIAGSGGVKQGQNKKRRRAAVDKDTPQPTSSLLITSKQLGNGAVATSASGSGSAANSRVRLS